MSPEQISDALANIEAESDPPLKHLKLASLVSAIFRESGIELIIVGGSAIEFYTEGAYTSGDVDLCVLNARTALTLRLRQELMGRLGGRGGPRSWEVGGAYIDVLGSFESDARTPARELIAPFGAVKLSPVEELIVERILISKYPQDYPPALDCVKKLLAAALQGEVQVEWKEVFRLAKTSAYANWTDVKTVIDEQAKALQVGSPCDSNE